jgi:hypothetical protein
MKTTALARVLTSYYHAVVWIDHHEADGQLVAEASIFQGRRSHEAPDRMTGRVTAAGA